MILTLFSEVLKPRRLKIISNHEINSFSELSLPFCHLTRKKDLSLVRNLKFPSRPDILNKNQLHTQTLDTLNFIPSDRGHEKVILLIEIHKYSYQRFLTTFRSYSQTSSNCF